MSIKKFIHTIVTHWRPHLDEIFAIWLLRKFGEKVLPGSSTAIVQYWGEGAKTPGNIPSDVLESKGELGIGVWGGRFDEHPTKGQARKKDECAATLVAKALGVDALPSLRKMLRYVLSSDLNGDQPQKLASLVITMNKKYPENPEIVIDWLFVLLDADFAEQEIFWSAEKDVYPENIHDIEVNGRPMRVVVGLTDNENFGQFARSKDGLGASVVITRNSNGNVMVSTNSKLGISLAPVMAMLRQEEQQTNGVQIEDNSQILESEGTIPGAEVWFYQKTGEMILNGSPTARDVPPTNLSLDLIVDIVIHGLRM